MAVSQTDDSPWLSARLMTVHGCQSWTGNGMIRFTENCKQLKQQSPTDVIFTNFKHYETGCTFYLCVVLKLNVILKMALLMPKHVLSSTMYFSCVRFLNKTAARQHSSHKLQYGPVPRAGRRLGRPVSLSLPRTLLSLSLSLPAQI
jgi:hypothetical protein